MADDLHARIRKQIEFYFSDANLVTDKFLKEQIGQDSEGFVSLSVIATFKKIMALSSDVDAIAAALKDSEALVVDAVNKRVRRKEALPESYNPLPRTIYAKPIPEADSTEEVEKFFAQFGKVELVRRRFTPGKKHTPKPSVHVQFGSVEECQKLIDSPPAYKGQQLVIMFQAVHDSENEKKRESITAGRKAGRPAPRPVTTEGDAAAAPEDGEHAGGEAKPSSLAKGALAEIEGIAARDWRKVKDAFQNRGDVRFSHGVEGEEKKAYVLFANKEELEKAKASHEADPIKEGDVAITIRVLEGEEEDKALAQIDVARNANGDRGGRGGRGGRGRGGRGGRGRGGRGGRGRRNDQGGDAKRRRAE